MKTLLISGVCGRMGQMIAMEAKAHGFQVVAGIDPSQGADGSFPVYRSFTEVLEKPDMLIDFSVPINLPSLLAYAVNAGIPCVLGTTGYTQEDMKSIQEAAGSIPLFQSPNMSRGIYVLKKLAAQAARMLKGFDIEIIEKHHKHKADSPSGTALALLDAVKSPETLAVFGREGTQAVRQKQEIGVHAIRGGSVAGAHEIGFYGDNEVITLSHEAQGRGVFVSGALLAAAWLIDKPKGLYGMADLMED